MCVFVTPKGARTYPTLFLLAGEFVPALVTSIPYSWFLFSRRGSSIFSKVSL
jgi:hypothetical protein